MIMKKYTILVLFLALVGCNKEVVPINSTDTAEVPNKVEVPDISVIKLTTDPEFKVKKGTRHVTDQLTFNFVKTINADIKVYNINDVVIFEKTVSTPESEITFNIGSTYNDTRLKYGKYFYEISTSLPDGSAEKVFKGSFDKILRPMATFTNKISDISIFGDTLYVATGDMMTDVEVRSINIKSDDIKILPIPGKDLPKPIYDMTRVGNKLYIGGRKDEWMGGKLLVEYDLDSDIVSDLDSRLSCKTKNDDECSAVFSLAYMEDQLYIGTSDGLFSHKDDLFSKITEHGLDEFTDFKSLFVDSQDRVWAGSMMKGGISYYAQDSWTPMTELNSEMPAGGILAFSEDNNRNIYMANNINGLIKYDSESNNLKQFTPHNSGIIDHNLVSVAYTDGIIVGSHDYGIAKSEDGSDWKVTDSSNSLMAPIKTDACQWSPDSAACKKVLVVERIVENKDGRVFAAIGKGIYELY